MCLIAIHKTGLGHGMTDAQIKAAYAHNSDGFGAMWPDARAEGGVATRRALPATADACVALYRQWAAEAPAGVDIAWHWRYRTHGPVCLANVHPFTTARHGCGVMHNGVIAKYGDNVRSDTRAYVEDTIEPLLEKGDLVRIERDTVGSRVAICYHNGITRIGTGWTEVGGVWVSNTYSLAAPSTRYSWTDDLPTMGRDLTSEYEDLVEEFKIALYDGEDADAVIERLIWEAVDPEEAEIVLQAAAWRERLKAPARRVVRVAQGKRTSKGCAR